MNKKFIILLTVMIDVLGIGIIIPILPFYVESFGASAFVVTVLFAVFALFSFFSAPLLGALSDRIGRRPVLIISIASTALGWLVFAAATNIIWLFVGRIIDGLAAGNFPIAQSYLIDIAKTDKERTSNLGLIGAVFGVGLIIGPLLGGLLSQISLSFPFWFVGVLAIVNTILVIRYLPETNKNLNKALKTNFNPFGPISQALKSASLKFGMIAWFLFGLALAGQQAVLSLYLAGAYNLSSFYISLVLAGMGVVLVLNQAIFLKKVWLKYFSEPKLIYIFLLVLAYGFMLLGASLPLSLIIGLFMLSVGQSVLRVVFTSLISKKNPADQQGMVLGLLSSIMSLSMILGPIVAGSLFSINMALPFWMCAVFCFLALIIMVIDRRINRGKPLTINSPEFELSQ